MRAADEILAALPLGQRAAQPGIAEQAVSTGLPALFAGVQANVTDSDQGSFSLASTLTRHSEPQFFDGGVSRDGVDTSDGQGIVNHIFADALEQPRELQASSAGADDVIGRALPILAPIVLAYLATKQHLGGSGLQQPSDDGLGGGMAGLGDLLGPILGGLFGR
ncbi:DUF937 domain-containing protein [Micropruina sp.]|uniref:DUF937 domain-containing protein n=1 Tax=Micropruina sp. TaxID=2737536 RepID=UPI0039E5BC09